MKQTENKDLEELPKLWDAWIESKQLHIRDRIIAHYSPWLSQMVSGLYSRHRYSLAEWSDYFSFASIGLISAIERFDPSLNIPFEAYAYHRVKGATLNGLSSFASDSQRVIPLSSDSESTSLRSEDSQTNDDTLTNVIDAAVGFALGSFLELGIVVHENDETSPEFHYQSKQQQLALSKYLSQLPPREELILKNHYVNQIELREIAKMLNVSAPRVTQLHHQALRRLRSLYEQE